MINANDLYYNDDDAVEYIKNETGLNENLIQEVLNAEFEYMKSVGLIEEPEED